MKKAKQRTERSSVTMCHDVRASSPNEIASYLHCTKCLRDITEGRAPDVAPKDYARTQLGITRDGGIQVWCSRHDVNVDRLFIASTEPSHSIEVLRELLAWAEAKGHAEMPEFKHAKVVIEQHVRMLDNLSRRAGEARASVS